MKKNEINNYNNSFFKHNDKNLITLNKIDFSNSIFNNREKIETSRPLMIDNQTIFIAGLNYFYKVNYQKGFITYKKKLLFSIFGNINLVDNDKIIFFASDGNIYLTDFDLKKIYWKYHLNDESVIGDYKIIDNNIIFKTSKDRVYSLNKETSNLNWVTKSYLSDYMPLNADSEIIISDNKIFAGFSDGKVSIFDIKTGKTLYEESITTDETFNDIIASITIKDNIAFIPSYKKGIVAIDLKTMDKIWNTSIPSISQLFIVKNFGYYFSQDEMIKISIKTGKILNKYKLSISNPSNYFLYKDDYIIISSKDVGVYLIDINNLKNNSKIGVSSGVSVKPVLKDDKLIILTNNSNLYVLKVK
jgi:outer membrane protein assembly factor BamB